MAEVRTTDKRQEGQVIDRYRTISVDTEEESEPEEEPEPENINKGLPPPRTTCAFIRDAVAPLVVVYFAKYIVLQIFFPRMAQTV